MNALEFKKATVEDQQAELARIEADVVSLCAKKYKNVNPAKPVLEQSICVFVTFDGEVIDFCPPSGAHWGMTWTINGKDALCIAILKHSDWEFIKRVYQSPHTFGGEYDNKYFKGLYDYLKPDSNGDVLFVAGFFCEVDGDEVYNCIKYRVGKFGTKEENERFIETEIYNHGYELVWNWRCRFDYEQIAKDHLECRNQPIEYSIRQEMENLR